MCVCVCGGGGGGGGEGGGRGDLHGKEEGEWVACRNDGLPVVSVGCLQKGCLQGGRVACREDRLPAKEDAWLPARRMGGVAGRVGRRG